MLHLYYAAFPGIGSGFTISRKGKAYSYVIPFFFSLSTHPSNAPLTVLTTSSSNHDSMHHAIIYCALIWYRSLCFRIASKNAFHSLALDAVKCQSRKPCCCRKGKCNEAAVGTEWHNPKFEGLIGNPGMSSCYCSDVYMNDSCVKDSLPCPSRRNNRVTRYTFFGPASFKCVAHSPSYAILFKRPFTSCDVMCDQQVTSPQSNTTPGLMTPVTVFRHLIRVSDSTFDAARAWTAFLSLRDSGDVSRLTDRDLFHFARKIAKCKLSPIAPYSPTEQDAGDLQVIVEELDKRCPLSYADDSLEHKCLAIQSASVRGNISEAISMLDTVEYAKNREEQCTSIINAHKQLICQLAIHVGPARAFEYFIDNRVRLKELMECIGLKGVTTLAKKRNPFFSIVSNILRKMPSIANYIAEQDWDNHKILSAANVILGATYQNNQPDEALGIYEMLNDRGLRTSFGLQHTLVRVLARNRKFDIANSLYDSMTPAENSSLKEKRSYAYTGMALYSRQGLVEDTEDSFALRCKLGEVMLQHMTLTLQASSNRSKKHRVLQLFDDFFQWTDENNPWGFTDVYRPNVFHYTASLHAFAKGGDIPGMMEKFNEMIENGIMPDTVTYNVIIKAFADRDDMESVNSTFQQMDDKGVPRDVITYTIIMSALANRRDVLAAEALYRRMVRDKISPDVKLVTTLMDVHAQAGSWNGVIRAFDYLRTVHVEDLRPDIEVMNVLLKAYVVIGAPLEVLTNIVQRMELADLKPNDHTFALLIQSACESGRMDAALRLFSTMEKLAADGKSDIHIDAYILTIIMAGYLRRRNKAEASKVYDDMRRRGIQLTSTTYRIIMQAYANVKSEESIRIVQDFLSSLLSSPAEERTWSLPVGGRLGPLEQIYYPLMNAYRKRLDIEQIEYLYQEYIDRGGVSTIGILVMHLDVYRRTSDIDGVHRVWSQIVEIALARTSTVDALLDSQDTQSELFQTQRRADLLCVPLSIYIDALSWAGQHTKIASAWNYLRQEGFRFDAHNWNHLAVALVRAGEPERAFEVVERIILPAQADIGSIIRKRDEGTRTPLLFDDEEATIERLREPFLSSTANVPKKRPRLVRKTRRLKIEGGEDEEDYAFELNTLQQISPAWNVWHPHFVTLQALSFVLERLKSGRLIGQTKEHVEIMDEKAPGESLEDHRNPVQLAGEMLQRIYEQYPLTVRAIEMWEYQYVKKGDRIQRAAERRKSTLFLKL